MKVSKALKSNGQEVWLLIDGHCRVVVPVAKYLFYLEAVQRSPNTIRSYTYDLKLYFEYLSEWGVAWHTVNSEIISNFINWLAVHSSRSNPVLYRPRQRSSKTINRILSTIKSFYEFHSDECYLNLFSSRPSTAREIPAFKGLLHGFAKLPVKINTFKLKAPRSFPGCLKREEVMLLLEYARSFQERLVISILYETGARIGETLNLRHRDMTSGRENFINIVQRNERTTLRNKSVKSRKIHVSSGLMRLYSDYLIEEYPMSTDLDYVFVREAHERSFRLTYSQVYSLFKRLERRTGIKVRPHLFRHTHATELLRKNVSISYVQQRLGHAHFQTTMNTYSHLSDADLLENFNKFMKNEEE